MNAEPQKRIFQFPTNWIHGTNAVANLPHYIHKFGSSNAIIIADAGVKAIGHLEKLTGIMESSGISYEVFDQVEPEPYSSAVDGIVGKIAEKKPDLYIAIGGGSTIDVAKGLCLLSDFSGSIKDYAGIENVKNSLKTPLIAIPTTSGTGSEVSPGAVFTDPEKESKFAVVSWNLAPKIALTDPALTITVPKRLTAITGIDAFAHAAESFVSRLAMPVTEQFAIKAIELVGESLEHVVNHPHDLAAREKMQIASTMAMISAGNAQNGLAHAIAMPLAAKFKLPHGLAVGAILPRVMEFNLESAPEKFKRIAVAFRLGVASCGVIESGKLAIDFVRKLSSKIGIPEKLSQIGVSKSDIGDLVAGTMASIQISVNPRSVEPEQVSELIEKAL